MALPSLSNAAQLKIMRLVKAGMPMDEAMSQAQELAANEEAARVCCFKLMLPLSV